MEEIDVVVLVLTWTGIVLGTTMLLLMAFGPVIVELDGWLVRRRQQRRSARAAGRGHEGAEHPGAVPVAGIG